VLGHHFPLSGAGMGAMIKPNLGDVRLIHSSIVRVHQEAVKEERGS
jgi:hypothetical protein